MEVWQALHFDYYNRYSTHGDNSPPDVHPEHLFKEDCKKPNKGMFIPRASCDIREHSKEFFSLSEVFASVFDALKEEVLLQLRRMLPDTYEVESLYASVLPNAELSPVFPFSGLVVNLNLCSSMHKDDDSADDSGMDSPAKTKDNEDDDNEDDYNDDNDDKDEDDDTDTHEDDASHLFLSSPDAGKVVRNPRNSLAAKGASRVIDSDPDHDSVVSPAHQGNQSEDIRKNLFRHKAI
ncbi:hypothetical protein ONZ45_g7363 [Pleurotus djamor]|nr:hypothetical protein ONZ45_g7363 [Pleurotus djamor]